MDGSKANSGLKELMLVRKEEDPHSHSGGGVEKRKQS